MALTAFHRPGGLIFLLVFPVAGDALAVHHLFFPEAAVGFHLPDHPGAFGKKVMAGLTIGQDILMHMMGKIHRPPRSSIHGEPF